MIWPDPLSLTAFCLIVAAVLGLFLAAVAYITPKAQRARTTALAAALTGLWLLATAGLSWSGFFDVEAPATRAAPYMITCLLVAILLAASPLGRKLALGLPLAWLVAFHTFRLPLELVLHDWADQGTIPEAMSFLGQNFDIATGVLAPMIAPLATRHRWAVLLFQLLGLGMLLNIVRIVVQHVEGSPFYRAGDGPPLELPLHVPTTWIVSVCVLGAVAGHLIVARRLWHDARSPSP